MSCNRFVYKTHLRTWGKGSLNPPREVRKSFKAELALELVREDRIEYPSHAQKCRKLHEFVIVRIQLKR